MRKKLFIASQIFLFMGVLSIILAGCGGGGTASTPQVLNWPNIGTQDVATLDPALIEDLNSAYALGLIDSGLVTLDPKTLKVVPDLASSWEISSDGLTYTFHLRPNLKFSNGDPLTAQDFAYSIDRAFDPAQSKNSYTPTYYLSLVKGGNDRAAGKIPTMIGAGNGLVVVDDQTLQINITQPALYFLDAMTYPVSWPVDKKVIDKFGANWFDGNFVGTGPFILKSWQHKVELKFVPNPNWWGTKPTLTEIDMPMIVSPDTAWKRFQAKEADVSQVPVADYPIAKGLGSKEFAETPELAIQYIAFNSSVPPFTNLTVRQAFAEAIDRDTISNQVWGGTVLPSDHIVPQGQPGYYAGLQGLPFNPTDAKTKLLSVYSDLTKMPAVTITYPKIGTDEDKFMAKVQQDYQTYLGVNIALNPVDFDTEVHDITTSAVQAYQLGWIADYPDPQDWMDLVTTGNSNNTMSFSNAQVDSLVKQADASQDENQRISLYNQAEEIAVDNVAWAPIFQQKNIYVFQKYVQGFVFDAQGLVPDIAWSNVTIAAH